VNKQLVYDFDFIKFACACVGEKRTIRVTHPCGIDETFKTRTVFFGKQPRYDGGWLADVNKHRKDDRKLRVCDFTIEDIQTPEPIENVLHNTKQAIKNICTKLGVNNYYGYVGRGDSWRVEKSTLLKYKGQRADLLRPIHLNAVEEYLVKYHNAQIIEGLEADDAVVIDSYKNKSRIVVAEDKDALGVSGIFLFNPNLFETAMYYDGLGFLEKRGNTIEGRGRMFFYFQVLSGDATDHYKANCFSDMKWGDASAYKALVDCKTDQECWQTIVDCYKKLYPEPKTVTGWRGNEILIDWKYVLQENVTMAHMLRWVGDEVIVEDVLNKLGVKY